MNIHISHLNSIRGCHGRGASRRAPAASRRRSEAVGRDEPETGPAQFNIYYLISNFLLLFATTLLVIIFIKSPAQAIESGPLAIYPTKVDPKNPISRSWFVYKVNAGETLSDEVTVENKSNAPLTVKIYAADATTTAEGAFTLSSVKEGLGLWLAPKRTQISLEAKSQVIIPFTLNVPIDAPTGDSVGAIVVEEVNAPAENPTGVTIVSRLGARVYITVAGETKEKLEILKLEQLKIGSESDSSLNLTIKNEGNVILRPEASVTVLGLFGARELRLGNIGQVLAGKTVDTALSLDQIPSGALWASVKLNYGTTTRQEIEKSLFLVNVKTPLIALGLIAVLLAVLFFSAAYWKNKSKTARMV